MNVNMPMVNFTLVVGPEANGMLCETRSFNRNEVKGEEKRRRKRLWKLV
jgi:hypothetical protein